MNSTGYGPSAKNQWQNITFDGDERKFELWEVKILGYMKIKKLKHVFVSEADITDDQNEMAFSELIQFLDERSISLIMREARDDGRKAFQILKEHYAGSGKPRIISLYTQLTSLKKNSTESITDYILRAESTTNALCNAKETVSDGLLVAMVVKGLPDEYKSFIAVTTQSEEMVQNFQKFKQALKNFEDTEQTRTKPDSYKDSNSVMKTNDYRKQPNRLICYNCGVAGHKSSECTKPPKEKKWCNYCRSPTHNDNVCRKQQQLHSSKMVNSETANENEHTYVFKINDNNALYLTSEDTDKFLVDCGATTHIVNKDTNFVETDQSFKPEEHFIELADGSKSNNLAKKKGTVSISLRSTDGKIVNATLENVLYVPSFPQCIFSVQAATKKGAKVNFDGDHAMLITKNGTSFPIEQHGRLYYLCKTSTNNKRSESLEMWHKLLGHCNLHDVKKLEGVVQGMNIVDTKDFDCETCILSKQTNTRNKEADIRATKPFELIHTDLAGPIDPVAKDGFRYAIIFTDDFSGCTFTYFLKEKSDALKATEKFLADVNPYGKVKAFNFHADVFPAGDVERIRSDNGGEYISNEFKSLLTKHGIKHELSSPHSPHQNGTAERNWRTLFDMARALLIESRLPKYLWTYAVMTATYIRNRCYVQRIKNTPYSLITGLKPNIAKLHIFGTTCYPYIHNTKKLDPRCRKGYFVGYDRDSPSYLVYYPENRTVMKHRLVKFTDKFQATPDEPELLITPPADNAEETVTTAPAEAPKPADPVPLAEPRYPQRNRQPPSYLADYDQTENSDNNDNVNRIDFCYMMNAPLTYDEAMSSRDSPNWKTAMDEQIESLQLNNTYTLTDPPANKSIVGGKWVFTVKGDPNDPTYKARYVAKGYSQIQGIDYAETFSPTARMESVRTLMQIAVQYDLLLHQLDVKSAYLHAPIDEDVYVTQPTGYEIGNKVWKLNKSLYGLKQSGRNWHKLLHEYLCELDFLQSTADPCLYFKRNGSEITILLVWVDDIIVAASSNSLMSDIKEKLSSKFKMKDLGILSTFLGIKFTQSGETITMSQSHYLENVLKTFGMYDCRPRSTPCEQNLSSYAESKNHNEENRKYRQMVGSLIYAMTCTRPDLAFVVTKLSQHLSCPDAADWAMLKHVFQYVKRTLSHKLMFRKSTTNLRINAFCDADWASSLKDRHSITGYYISLTDVGPPISWKSKKQTSVALSTCEAEYMSLSITCQEVIYLTRLANELLPSHVQPAIIRNDNQGALSLVKNPVKHSKSKHIDIRYHFIRECYNDGQILLDYVPSAENVADVFTKPPKKHSLSEFGQFLFGKQ